MGRDERDESCEATDAIDLGRRGVADGRRRYSLLVDRGAADDVAVVGLWPDQAVEIGRAADLSIADGTLSRRHARFVLDARGAVVVEDLGSCNGTYVNGERISAPVVVGVADKVALGAVAVTLHVVAPPAAGIAGLEAHDRFQSMLEYEVERARTFEGKVALLMIRSVPPSAELLARWCPRVRGLLRPIDRLALYGASTVEALLPEADAAQAERLARAIAGARAPGEPPLSCGVALFPDGAASAEELVEVARAALRGTAALAPVCTVASQEQRLLLGQTAAGALDERGVVVASPAMVEIYRTVDRLARSTIPVLIQGETGTGKELIAQAIHDRGPRRGGPLAPVNCGAIPEALLESALFGHKRGAFTGAERSVEGIFVGADGGTVFLDEVGELSPAAQVALLRVLEAKVVVPVGGNEQVPVDVRIVAATHRDLERMCQQGGFRWDLLYRLNTMVIDVPPLRERPEEIGPLARRFLEQARADGGGAGVAAIARDALEALRRYDWPGNVRQLRNVVERAVAIAATPVITTAELPERVRAADRWTSALTPVQAPPAEDLPRRDDGLREQLKRYSVALIRIALAEAGGSAARAAERLGLPRRTLSHKLQTLGLAELPADPEGDRRLAELGPSAAELPGFRERVERFERGLLEAALARHQRNLSLAAAELDLPERTLRHKLVKHRLG